MKLVFEKSVPGRTGVLPGPSDVPTGINIRADLLRERSARMPELSELDVVRHFTELSRRNFGVDTNFYPLGSCTMKYNPKVNEWGSRLPGFARVHPYAPDPLAQGCLEVLGCPGRPVTEVQRSDAARRGGGGVEVDPF